MTTAMFTTRPTTNQVATTKATGVAADVSNTIEGIAGFADSVVSFIMCTVHDLTKILLRIFY